jgi:hypothetical protein
VTESYDSQHATEADTEQRLDPGAQLPDVGDQRSADSPVHDSVSDSQANREERARKRRSRRARQADRQRESSQGDMPGEDAESRHQRTGRVDRPGPPNPRIVIIYVLLAIVLGVYMFNSLRGGLPVGAKRAESLSTNAFVVAVKENRVSSVTFKVADGKLTGSFWPAGKEVGKKGDLAQFESTYVGADSLQELMAAHPQTKFVVDTSDSTMLELLLTTFLPTATEASQTCCRRWMWEAKEDTKTRPGAFLMMWRKVGPTSASEGVNPGLSALVESLIRRSMPSDAKRLIAL